LDVLLVDQFHNFNLNYCVIPANAGISLSSYTD